jgi:hypothetical protein
MMSSAGDAMKKGMAVLRAAAWAPVLWPFQRVVGGDLVRVNTYGRKKLRCRKRCR